MTRTLVLAERPFGDLRGRATMRDLVARRGQGQPLLIPSRAPSAPPGFQPIPPGSDLAAFGVSRVALAGCFQEKGELEWALAEAARAIAAGARFEALGLSVEGGVAETPPRGVEVLDGASSIELRDFLSANTLTLWRVAAPLRVNGYPEARIAPDPGLAASLPPGPLLGVAISAGNHVRKEWMARADGIGRLLAQANGWPAVPLPIEATGTPADDLPSTRAFIEALLPEAPVLLPELSDFVWRQRQFTVARMKAVVARCALVVTNQDLPAAMAITSGVPVLGLALANDRRIVASLSTLANEAPPGSELAFLPVDPPVQPSDSRASSSARA